MSGFIQAAGPDSAQLLAPFLKENFQKENEKCAEIKEFLIALETLVKLQNNKE